ncbi:MAG: type II toxin-antitoxin system death-on-curing family toxin [Pseudomonadota bacterium]
MNEPRWLKNEIALTVHSMLLAEHGGSGGVRDKELLESALHRPQQKYAYEKACSLYDLAASLSFGIAKNHPFVDGNKRVALTLGLVFLEINGIEVNAPEADAAATFEALAAGSLSELELSQWLRFHGGET